MATPLTSYNVAPNPNDAPGASALPIGAVTLWATSTAPSGWLLCNGSAVSRTLYAALFAVVGTTWGAGDGSTTFNVPNTAGRVVRGVNGTYTQALTGGADSVTLAANNLPNHSHSLHDPGHVHNLVPDRASTAVPGGSLQAGNGQVTGVSVTGIIIQDSVLTGATTTTPGTQVTQVATNIVNPYLAMNYIIKTA